MAKRVLYPGSFDPVTNGHLDVIRRAVRVFDELIVAVSVNRDKTAIFSVEERCELLRRVCAEFANVRVESFEGLIVDAVGHFECSAVVRGLRAASDFEFEFQMALMNRELNSCCETVFMTPRPKYTFVSSKLVREIAAFGGDISAFVPDVVFKALRKRLTES